ncbi:MAG TPA: VOC family protein [Acidisoma sp.]|jgi:predicted enzyme related to lactoylglutathione lyase|uniref:VOC family protein n=1 Tax=Acidisoma sp. TaxID=1872115 RepID=UPI002B57EA94|nr:VOC family protein [Acidisoma sp.]HTI02434.1 VOC family protein [Acidisoma sp.]
MKQGDFVWHELCTTDPVAAAAFYGKVVGWTIRPSGLPGIDYSLACLGDRQIAGIMTLPAAQMPPRPIWFGYIAVDDVDAKAKEIETAGGSIHKAPEDIPSIGRFAVVSDPQGAVFMLFKGAGEPPPPLGMMQTGSVGWNELHARDAPAIWPFYEETFGWSKDTAHDMGPMGVYQLFKGSGLPCGGMMTDTQSSPHPYWLYYFVVDDIDAGLERVKSNGGTVLFGPQEVPGGAWIINAQDPQGGNFALVGMRKG